AEVALSSALLVAAGMAVKSIAVLNRTDFGIKTESMFTARVDLPASTYGDTASRVRFYDDLARQLSSDPSARSVALTTALPLAPAPGDEYEIEGERYATSRDRPFARSAAVTPGFFSAFGIA